MQVEAYLNGMISRSDEALRLGSAWLRGRATKDEFDAQLEKETQELITLQQQLGLTYVVDGQLQWPDFLRPIAHALGLHRLKSTANENAVTRQIYTNTFYRKPLILKRIEAVDTLVDESFVTTIEHGKRKVILPSPFALVYLSDGIHRDEHGTLQKEIFEDVLLDVARLLNTEAQRLEKSGVSFIQFTDPCLAYAPEVQQWWDSIAQSLRHATSNLKGITSLHLHNGDVAALLPDVLTLPVQRIGVDAYTTNLRAFSNAPFPKVLEAGVVNAKNSLIETPEQLARYAEQLRDTINPEGLALVPNRPLELVPQHIARKKIESLAKAARLVGT